jgi:hypothetical protein
MTMSKLASVLLLGIGAAMCAFGLWAFVADPFFYGSSNGSGGGVRIVGRWVLPIVAALVATLALRSVSRREPSS